MNQQRQLACLIPNLQKATRKGDASEELGAHSGHVPFVNAPQSADTAISLPNARTFFFFYNSVSTGTQSQERRYQCRAGSFNTPAPRFPLGTLQRPFSPLLKKIGSQLEERGRTKRFTAGQ